MKKKYVQQNPAYHHHFNKTIWISIKNLFLIFMFISFIVIAIFLRDNFNFSILLFILTIDLFLAIICGKILFDEEPLIGISNEGVLIAKTNQFILWEDIKSMRIDKVSLISSTIFYNYEVLDNMHIFLKDASLEEVIVNIQGLKNRKTLVALADYYIEKCKGNHTQVQSNLTDENSFRMAVMYKVLKLSIPIVILIIGFYISYTTFILGLVLVGFGTVIFGFSMASIHSKIIVQVDSKGIWSKKFDLIPWNKIDFVRIENVGYIGQLLDKDFMVIYLKNSKFKYALIDITGVENRDKLRQKVLIN